MSLIHVILRKAYFFHSHLRGIFWRNVFGGFGERSNIFGRIIVQVPEQVYMGSRSTLNEGVLLNARAPITIGDDVHISSYCIINTATLEYGSTRHERTHIAKPVTIEDGVWLGSGVIVNPGVRIGKNSVVGAGGVVTQDIPPDTVAVGVPAKPIKSITRSLYEQKGRGEVHPSAVIAEQAEKDLERGE